MEKQENKIKKLKFDNNEFLLENSFLKIKSEILENFWELIISIIGMGYVGLPLSILYAKNNIRTIGIDIDKKKIENLKY